MISGGVNSLFFGMGLLVSVGSIDRLYIEMKDRDRDGKKLADKLILRLMKAFLYYDADTQRACQNIFQILNFFDGQGDLSIAFCMDEVYRNYPETMYKIANQYETNKNGIQVQLAQMIKTKYEEQLKDRENSYGIKDIRSSTEHRYIYYKAQMKQNSLINKMARKNSIASQLFPERIMKYGKRSGHIITDREEKKTYQASPYFQYKYQIELPMQYIMDPVEYEFKKNQFLKEVNQDEISIERIFAAIERER